MIIPMSKSAACLLRQTCLKLHSSQKMREIVIFVHNDFKLLYMLFGGFLGFVQRRRRDFLVIYHDINDTDFSDIITLRNLNIFNLTISLKSNVKVP